MNTLLVLLISAALLAGSWLLGKRHGEHKAATVARQALSTDEAKDIIFSLQAQLRSKEAELMELRENSQAGTARSQVLQSELDKLLKARVSDEHDLALYRRIENNQAPRGIAVESLSWESTDPERLDVAIIQWQGRDRATGEMQLTLNYSTSVPGSSKEPDKGNEERVLWKVDLDPIAFDFRFFQKFKVAMGLPAADLKENPENLVLPDSVGVRITSSNKRLKAIDKRISWDDIAE